MSVTVPLADGPACGFNRSSAGEFSHPNAVTAADMTADPKDLLMKLFENFVQAPACKCTLQAFNVMCSELGLEPLQHATFYSRLKDSMTTWKAKALWSKLDKRFAHKEYKKGRACVGTKVKYCRCFAYTI